VDGPGIVFIIGLNNYSRLLDPALSSRKSARRSCMEKWNPNIRRLNSENAPTAPGWRFARPEKTG
jgi:hypothetical protein